MYIFGETLAGLLSTDIGALITLLVAAIIFTALSGIFFKKSGFGTRALVYTSLAIALAFILSYFRLFQMPMGGSVTPMSMFFVSVIGFWFGPAIGLVGGISFGLLQLAQNPQVIHPMQLILDYPLAFGMLGLSGFFYKMKYGLYIGFIVGATGRWLMATLSGYFFWTQMWPPEGWNSYMLFSMVYNAAYIYAELGISLAIILIPSVKNALRHVGNMVVISTASTESK